MKKLLLFALLVVGCVSQKQITPSVNDKVNPCDDILYIQTNPDILKDCFPNYTLFGIGVGTSSDRSVAQAMAKESAKMDLGRNIEVFIENAESSTIYTMFPEDYLNEQDSLFNSITILSGVVENSIILKAFTSKEGARYNSIVIIAGTLGEKNN